MPDGAEVKAMEQRLGEKSRITGRDETGAYLRFDQAVVDYHFPKKGTLKTLFMPRETNLSTPLSLPMGVKPGMSRESVRALLGNADKENAARKFMNIAFPATDIYQRPEFSLAIKYSPDDVVAGVQISLRNQ